MIYVIGMSILIIIKNKKTFQHIIYNRLYTLNTQITKIIPYIYISILIGTF